MVPWTPQVQSENGTLIISLVFVAMTQAWTDTMVADFGDGLYCSTPKQL